MNKTFVYKELDTFKLLYTTYVRPHLEFAISVWNPNLKKDQQLIEHVQRRATKLIPCLKDMSYEDRLRELSLTSLMVRRIRGDLIQYYKIKNKLELVTWSNGPKIAHYFSACGPSANLRGHDYKLVKEPAYKLRGPRCHFFSNRIVNYWNSLSSDVVNSTSLNLFKSKLDEFMENNMDIFV